MTAATLTRRRKLRTIESWTRVSEEDLRRLLPGACEECIIDAWHLLVANDALLVVNNLVDLGGKYVCPSCRYVIDVPRLWWFHRASLTGEPSAAWIITPYGDLDM